MFAGAVPDEGLAAGIRRLYHKLLIYANAGSAESLTI